MKKQNFEIKGKDSEIRKVWGRQREAVILVLLIIEHSPGFSFLTFKTNCSKVTSSLGNYPFSVLSKFIVDSENTGFSFLIVKTNLIVQK